MKKLLLTAMIVFGLNFYCSSQNNSAHPVDTKYLDYFDLNPESIYTQLNKSTYFQNEELWFKTYIYNLKTQKPYLSTTNVYASIYNIKGRLIVRKLFLASAGSTHGNFKLDSLFSSGIYFLKTHTNWMKNFNEDYSNIQKFEIIDGNPKNDQKEYSQKMYDFQILPEGGHSVNGVTNNFGFKILDSNGKSPEIVLGEIYDMKKNLITTFKSNSFGIGKFEIKMENGKEYFSQITLDNNKMITSPLPKAENTGIVLNINNRRNDKLLVILKTNQKTLSSIIGKPYFLLIHRDGLIKKIKIEFVKEKFEYLISIPKENLHDGINILTLFNDNNKPINERIFYNNKRTPKKSVFVSKIIKGKDSSRIILSTNINDSIPKTISVSILPSATESYNDKSTILSSFLLNPYINGSIENPVYYFRNEERETLFDLDLLLLTQGWSKYSWHNIFNNPPKMVYDFELGFNIKGVLNRYKHHPSNQLLLLSKENFLHIHSKIENENQFIFENLFISANSKLNFSIETKNGKLIKPHINYTIRPNFIVDSIDTSAFLKYQKKEITNQLDNFSIFLSDSINVLDVVQLKTVSKKVKPKNKPFGTFRAKYLNFSESKHQNSLITDQIRNNGFDVTNNGFNVRIKSRRYSTLKGSLSPTVYLDNIKLDNSNLINIANLKVLEVEEMFISKQGSIYASPGGVIHIFTKKGQSRHIKERFIKSDIDFGFSESIDYYSPKYDTSNYDKFSKFGVIYWVPNITTNTQGEVSFKIPNYTNGYINLYVEGMGDDGSLFSKIEKIKI